jgi:hypothetical protein
MRPTRIKGLSDRRRLPRLGKIHLGVKDPQRGFPKKTDYFVCPPEVQAVYGATPRDLDVILPVDDPEQIFPQAYKCYRAGVGLWCTGDGETGWRVGKDKDGSELMEEVECPCELVDQKKCKQMGNLMVILPRVSLGGVYQIDTGSINSITDINSGLDFIRDRAGRLNNVPCILTLRPRETTVEGKKSVIYTMNLVLANFETIKRLQGQMTEIRQLLGGDVSPRVALPAPSVETDLIPADVVQVIDHEEAEEAPPAPADDFTPPGRRASRPAPAPAARVTTVETAPEAPAVKAQTVEEVMELWDCGRKEAEDMIAAEARRAQQANPAVRVGAVNVPRPAMTPTPKPAQRPALESF